MSWASALVMGKEAFKAGKALYKGTQRVGKAMSQSQPKQKPVAQSKPKQTLKPSAPQKPKQAPSPAKKPAPVKVAKPAPAKGTKKVK